jgi:hypothetical protein
MKKYFAFFFFCAYCISCGQKGGGNDTSGKNAAVDTSTSSTTPKALAPPQVPLLSTLLLSKADFDILKAPPSQVLVFQFHFKATATAGNSPDLVVFPMKNSHVKITDTYKTLTPFSNSTVQIYGMETIYGDNQILIKDLNDLIDEVTGSHGGTGHFSSFLFTPMYDSTNKHIYFGITVVGAAALTTGMKTTNPSPPATAF